MASGVFGLGALDRLVARLTVYADPASLAPLAERLEQVIVEANRRNLLNALDGEGNPMVPVKYRGGFAIHAKTRSKNFGMTKGRHKPGVGGNLSAAEYRQLSGPPLVPRGEHSRLITNLFTDHYRQGDVWLIEGWWADILSAKGVPFMAAHFEGAGHLPKRDPRGIGPYGLKLALEEIDLWHKGLSR